MSELKFFVLTRVLTQNFNTMDLIKKFEKKSKTLHSNCNNHIEGDIMQNHQYKKKRLKTKILWVIETFFLAPCPSALRQF